ncbi:MAG: hypothetical protein ACRC2H_00350 [Silanimonas sp.]
MPHPIRFVLRGLLVAALALGIALPVANAAPSEGVAVTTRTYLKAVDGERDRLAEFVVANWFAMDAEAVAQGLFRDYRLIENVATDGEWDLVVEVDYHDACGYACVADRFEAIRAAHVTRRIDGRGLPELGRVLRTETVRPRA